MKPDKNKQFKSEIGSKAIVQHESLARSEEQEKYLEGLREVLADSALDLQKIKLVPPSQEYLGSFSVHVYASEALRQFSFVGITNPHKTNHPIAEAAMKKLTEDVNEYFTGRRRKSRSGF
jgi:hypothetical protein